MQLLCRSHNKNNMNILHMIRFIFYAMGETETGKITPFLRKILIYYIRKIVITTYIVMTSLALHFRRMLITYRLPVHASS